MGRCEDSRLTPQPVRGRLFRVVADSDRAAADRAATLRAAVTAHAVKGDTIVLRPSRQSSVSSNVRAIFSRVPSDSIASVEIIKGNSATALYGPRAVNGVIVITTKAGAKKN